MTIEERSRLSFYQELAPLRPEQGILLVRHVETGALFVRKELENVQPLIYKQLQQHPFPGMPRIVEAIEEEDRLIVIESYISGQNLQEKLDTDGPLPLREVLRVGIALCDILAPLHAAGIIHRDIKPANIIISDDGVVKLLDLDAAKLYRPEESRDTRLIGTKGYAAPEQYGFGASSPLTDIYAMGVLLHVLATGRFPDSSPAPLPLLEPVITCCTRLEPKERYQSAAALKQSLLILQASQPAPARVPVPENKPGNPSPKDAAVRRQAAPVPARKLHRFLPPGFRTGNPRHMLLAAPYYLLIIMGMIATVSTLVSSEDKLYVRILVGAAMFCVFVLPPFILFNYLNLWHLLRIDRIRKPFLRYLAAFGFYLSILLLLFLVGRGIVSLIQGTPFL